MSIREIVCRCAAGQALSDVRIAKARAGNGKHTGAKPGGIQYGL